MTKNILKPAVSFQVWDGEIYLELDPWECFMLPGEDGKYRHGSRGSVPADGIELQFATDNGLVPIAACVADGLVLPNLYRYDSEYFLFLRLIKVLNDDWWGVLPWTDRKPGEVFFAWDKFHDLEYSRDEDSVYEELSYGGDWQDLQSNVEDEFPLAEFGRLSAPSDHTPIRRVREKDENAVRQLLAGGANPNAGMITNRDTMPNANVSYPRGGTALSEAIIVDSLPIVKLLITAGAAVDGRADPGHVSALELAKSNDRNAIVEYLLSVGATD